MKEKIKLYIKNKELVAICVTALILVSGAIQYAFGLNYVIALTPLVLTAITAITIIFWPVAHKQRFNLVVAVIALGLFVELIGVNTGIIFGNYTYGDLLGLKILETPLLTGVMWLLVSVSIWQIVLLSGFNKVLMIILASSMAVIFDLLLEQYAINLNLWYWANEFVPFKNYISWFFVSAIIFILFAKFAKQERVSLYGATILPIIMTYFWLLIFIIKY